MAIGGYFSLELPLREEFHKKAIRLNTGRNCLEYILRVCKYKKVYIPYYTCEVILEPFKKLDVAYEFYHINMQFEIADDIQLQKEEALLYTNYFGLKQNYVGRLAENYGIQLIVDNTQAFYAKPVDGIDTFYTCRKFFGVADGAYLHTNTLINEEFEQDESYDRMTHLLKRIDLSAKEGYVDFRKADDRLDNQPIRRMSKLTQRIMQSINYNEIAQVRRKNYQFLHDYLASTNQLHLPMDHDVVPMVYPYLSENKSIKQKLISEKIYVATYWPNVMEWCNVEDWEYKLAEQTVFIPIDQRYGSDEMKRIITIIQKCLNK